MDQFNEKMGYATNSHVQNEDDKKAELKKNRENQRRLEEELRQLREKERELVKRIKEGEELQKKSSCCVMSQSLTTFCWIDPLPI